MRVGEAERLKEDGREVKAEAVEEANADADVRRLWLREEGEENLPGELDPRTGPLDLLLLVEAAIEKQKRRDSLCQRRSGREEES